MEIYILFMLLILVLYIFAWISERYNQESDNDKEALKCSNCKRKVEENDKICPRCGTVVEDEIEDIEKEHVETESKTQYEQSEDGLSFDFEFIEDEKQNNNSINDSDIKTKKTNDEQELYLNNYNGSMKIVEKIEKILNKYALGVYIEKDYVKFVLATFSTCIYFYGVVDEEHSSSERAKIDTYLIYLLIKDINNIDFENVMSFYKIIYEQLNAISIANVIAMSSEEQKFPPFYGVAITYLNNITQGKFEEHIKHITTASLNGLITEVAESFESILKNAWGDCKSKKNDETQKDIKNSKKIDKSANNTKSNKKTDKN